MNDKQILVLDHLSPSTINSFITNKPGFRNNKVLKRPFLSTPNMNRGKAVEHVINEWIRGKTYDERNVDGHIEVVALNKYDAHMMRYREEFPLYKPEEDKIRDTVGPCAIKAYHVYTEEIYPFTKPFDQTKLNVPLDGCDLHALCYLDFFIPGTRINDCKVLSRNASKLDQGYVIQGSVYRKGTGDPCVFDLFVPQKKGVIHNSHELSDDEFKFGWSYACRAAQAIEKLMVALREGDEGAVFRLMCFPDLSKVWNADEKKKLCDEWEIVYPPDLMDSEE